MPPSSSAASPSDAGARRARETLEAAIAKASETPDDIWVFGYASLIWRPEFDAVEARAARLLGWHRCLRMRSRINRGTPELPGLVFCLLNGGTCKGVAFRMSPRSWRDDLARLWDREMFTGVYEPRWLACRTPQGTVRALAFTLDRLHPNHTGAIADEAMLDILRHARGRYGTTLDYLLETARGLREHGIRDPEIERLVALAAHAGLMTNVAPSHAGIGSGAAQARATPGAAQPLAAAPT